MIIGGVGGSGTRVVAQIARAAGVNIGSYVNGSLDNVFFARLICQLPHLWTYPRLAPRFRTFTRLYFGQPLRPGDYWRLYRSARGPVLKWIWLHLKRSWEGRPTHAQYQKWGWKNPRSQYYLKQLATHFPRCKYVHVMRHGLDMAYSDNTSQYQRWGQYFGIPNDPDIPHASRHLDFWIAVNNWVQNQCRELLPDRHLILRFDDLCAQPEQEVARLLAFLEVSPRCTLEQLTALVQPPASLGRYQRHETPFTPEQVQSVRAFGFDVRV